MIQQEILDGTEVIAKFDGYIFHADDKINGIPGVYRKSGKALMAIDDFSYHCSYDTLMPIIEKIFFLKNVEIVLHMGSLEISVYEENQGLFQGSRFCIASETGLSCWFMSVVEFLKWYNKQKI